VALKTLGTAGASNLTGIAYEDLSLLDQWFVNMNIRDDLNPARPRQLSALQRGILWAPNRGYLRVLPGDYVCFDDRGWPILLSSDTLANGSSWLFSGQLDALITEISGQLIMTEDGQVLFT
jgi:hypothetical protein